MKLKSIKAHGFKSFADKIEINVGDGITGIVGPNGSGKSNVVDAVKWVLGESSLKEIRGGEHQADVIFAGSSSRKASSRAWVSLTFDNEDHYLASDLSEIEIKREIYNTGESDYYINNTKVRKKDITDLFLDSGAHADSFSIISQGKIMEILKGKPSDRRLIIEEAAGVLKYKKRKEETMRKLDNTKDNLEKVNLVISELGENIEPLRMQAETATLYNKYKGELTGIEIALLASDIKTINTTMTESKTNLDKLNNEILSLDSTSSVDNSKLETLKSKSLKLDEEISSYSDKLISTSQELSSLETKKQVISERKKYEVEDQKLENNILLLKENEVNFKKSANLLKEEIKTLDSLIEKKESEINSYRDEFKVSTVKKNTLNQELENKIKQENVIKNKIEILNDNLLNDTKLPYQVKSVLNNPRLKGIHDVLIKLIDTTETYATSIEVALGGNAFVVVVDDEGSAKSAINYLKDNKLGRVTFFPISIIKSRTIDNDTLSICKETPGYIGIASELISYNPLYKGIVENQLGNAIIVNNIETMNKLGKKINYKYRIITLDGEILHTGGSITGGTNNKNNGLINLKYEIDKLNKELNIVTNESKLLEEDINRIDSDMKVLENKIFELQANIANNTEIRSRKNIELNDIEKKIEDISNEIKGTNNLINSSVNKELDEVLKSYLDVSTKKDSIETKLNSLKFEKNDLISEINELELLNKKSNSEYNKKLMDIKELEVSIGKMDVKLDNLLNRLNEEYEITYEKAESDYVLDIEESTARSKVNHLRREIRDLGEVNLGSISEYERVSTRYNFLVEQRTDLENAINNLMEIITDLDITMEKRFKETFDLVNVEFGNVFKKLFKGGAASLIMTEPDNILLTGIDIKALPPGKSLKSITALSGGEMSLTAIALLFSILNIRTVPFCILDEVEAALDEANVDQFGTYIKEYENNSQFVVITHKKRTMEYANTLYGITMQESGVSKLVSVRLENL